MLTRDLRDGRWMYLKAALFLVIGLICGGLLFAENPKAQTAILLALLVWAMCRAYYFAFYVVQQYIDPAFKFSGLISFFRYLLRRR